ncbi:MAG: hypothetical protein JO084_09745 [Bradyrhizobiaceae bacterium]|nr:hypothetical protein [Bradyrhizobiaceae bacterium]
MGNSQKRDSTPPRDPGVVLYALGALSSPGRHNVRIFGLQREQMLIAAAIIICAGIPIAVLVAFLPFWDNVGGWVFIRRINSYIAPAIDSLPDRYHPASAPRFPSKRFLIASITMVEIVLLSNLVALCFRRVRRHALLVWTCYDRQKIFQYFVISAVAFCGLWYLLFFDWSFLAFLASSNRRAHGKFILYAAMALPFTAIVSGHMTAIIGLGALRDACRKLRRIK